MNTRLTLLVMAAGLGSRYGGLKQLDTFGPHGESLLEYSLFDAWQAGFEKVVLVIRPSLLKDFQDQLAPKLRGKMLLDFAFQEITDLPPGFTVPPNRSKPWGTGHAIWVAREKLNTPFAVINADDFYGRESYQLAAGFLLQPGQKENCLVAYKLAHTLSEHGSVARGICAVNPENYLEKVTEKTNIARSTAGILALEPDQPAMPLPAETLVSMNLMGFQPAVLPYFECYLQNFLRENGQDERAEFYFPAVVNKMVQDHAVPVKVLPSPAQWFGVTYPEDKKLVTAALTNLVRAGHYPENLWTGQGLAND